MLNKRTPDQARDRHKLTEIRTLTEKQKYNGKLKQKDLV
jgi:hypothetical protein